ncbi:MAG: PqqD family protein [Candidatus Coatesbacteria bacterium]
MNAVARLGIFSPPRRRIDQAEALSLVPVRAPHVRESQAGDEIVLSVRRRDGRAVRALSWFFTLPEHKTFQLDRIGAVVWRLCDGATPVQEIARRVGEDFGWPDPQARAAVLQFLSHLSERHLVGFPAAGDPARR